MVSDDKSPLLPLVGHLADRQMMMTDQAHTGGCAMEKDASFWLLTHLADQAHDEGWTMPNNGDLW